MLPRCIPSTQLLVIKCYRLTGSRVDPIIAHAPVGDKRFIVEFNSNVPCCTRFLFYLFVEGHMKESDGFSFGFFSSTVVAGGCSNGCMPSELLHDGKIGARFKEFGNKASP